MTEPLDWTTGRRALAYQACPECGRIAYFRRPFCPTCGHEGVETREASGSGTVYALTRVVRAPTPEWRALAPYSIALVDAAEGFRFMAHAADGLAIGDAVETGFREVGDAIIPYVTSTKAP